jgi:hypothetical protein
MAVCPTLPRAGSDLLPIALAAVIIVFVGLALVVSARRGAKYRRASLGAAIVLIATVSIFAMSTSARAAQVCPGSPVTTVGRATPTTSPAPVTQPASPTTLAGAITVPGPTTIGASPTTLAASPTTLGGSPTTLPGATTTTILDGPPPVVPEAPFAVLLGLGAAITIGASTLLIRRQQPRLASSAGSANATRQ